MNGQLKKGKKKINHLNYEPVDYEGEIDENGNACGIGKMFFKNNDVLSGMFYNDKTEGVCTFTYLTKTRIGERHRGEIHGKVTIYDSSDGSIKNAIWEKRVEIRSRDITQTPDMAFYRDGEIHRALDENWNDYILRLRIRIFIRTYSIIVT